MTPEKIKRATAYKLRIGDILRGNPIIQEERFKFLELGDKNITRVNIVANIVEKFDSDEKQYISLTLDDASGQIKVRIFGDDTEKFKERGQGDTIMLIGKIRSYNNELYLLPEIISEKDPRYLLVRKLELEKSMPKQNKEEILAVKDQIIDIIKKAEPEGGIETEKIIMELKSSPDIINQEIKKLIEEGLAYEPKPGKIRYLG